MRLLISTDLRKNAQLAQSLPMGALPKFAEIGGRRFLHGVYYRKPMVRCV